MKKKTYNITLILTFIGILFFAFGVLNTKVSLKYETEDPNDCISNVTGTDLCKAINYLSGLTFFCGISFIGLLLFRKNLIGNNELAPNRNQSEKLEEIFDGIVYQISKGNSIEGLKDGKLYLELEQVKEWKSRFGYKFNIYGNDHFINNKPHFHFDNKQIGISCKMSFEGEIFGCKGNKQVSRKTMKELAYFLSKPNTQELLVSMWNDKNPELKVKAST